MNAFTFTQLTTFKPLAMNMLQQREMKIKILANEVTRGNLRGSEYPSKLKQASKDKYHYQ